MQQASITTIQFFWLVVAAGWIAVECLITWKNRNLLAAMTSAPVAGERLPWLVVGLSLPFALWFKEIRPWPILQFGYLRQPLAIGLFMTGLFIRFFSVSALGRLFTTRVGIQHKHALITTGPYRYIRHPSYTGLLTGFIGAGLAMGDYMALIILVGPLLIVLIMRIEIEEHGLEGYFGQEYRDYCRTTKKLIPLLY